MSRAIKFRAWLKNENRYINVNRIDFADVTLKDSIFGNEFYDFNDLVLEQFTGLHDNSDDEKEVYENDIVLVNYGTNKIKAIVKFERGTSILVSDEFIDGYIPLFEVSESDREYEWINGIIIGNIHERSEDDDK